MFPEDCVKEDRSVAWLLAAREYPWLRTNETRVHILPSEILRMVHRHLVGPEVAVRALTGQLREYFPSESHYARRIAVDSLNYCMGSVSTTRNFIMRGERVTRPDRISMVVEEDEEGTPRCANCLEEDPCRECGRCSDCALSEFNSDPTCHYCTLTGQ